MANGYNSQGLKIWMTPNQARKNGYGTTIENYDWDALVQETTVNPNYTGKTASQTSIWADDMLGLNDAKVETDYVRQGVSQSSNQNISVKPDNMSAIDIQNNQNNFGSTPVNYNTTQVNIGGDRYVSAEYASGHSVNTQNSGVTTINGTPYIVGDNGSQTTLTQMEPGQAYFVRNTNSNGETTQQVVTDNSTININAVVDDSKSLDTVKDDVQNKFSYYVSKLFLNNKSNKEIFNEIKKNIKTNNSEYDSYVSDSNANKINYSKKVSLNVFPVTKLNLKNSINEEQWNNRLGYILGNSGLLYNTFKNDKGLVFPYTPKINYSYNVNYDRTEIIHSNLAVSHYRNSPPPSISITADFTADGKENATYMFAAIHFFRALSKCEFGEGYSEDGNKIENKYRGFPPPVLYLNGWGNMINNIPVIIKSFDINLDKTKHYIDVDVDDYGKVWLPTDITMNIGLEIQPNLNVYKDLFNLEKYKQNVMINESNVYTVNESVYYIGSGSKKTYDLNSISPSNYTSLFGSPQAISSEQVNVGMKSNKIPQKRGHIGMGWTW